MKKKLLISHSFNLILHNRFLALLMGPPESRSLLLETGRALGTVLSDQLFCQFTAYRAQTKAALLSGLDIYIKELTVLPPSSWDPSIRLDPPKNVPSVKAR